MVALAVLVLCANAALAAEKKGLLVYDSVYGSTVEIAYWIKAIIGNEHHLDIKSIPQVITVKPYDYIIIGSATRNEGPTNTMHEFLEANRSVLATKELCFFLACGDSDETQVLKVPGKEPHLIAGRNYMVPVSQRYPEFKFTCIAGVGGRQVMAALGVQDSMQIWLLEKLAKEGAIWIGRDIWESLVPERVEYFANEVRVKVLGLEPRENVEQFRSFWESLQPANLSDPSMGKFERKPLDERMSTEKIFYTRSYMKGDLDYALTKLQEWAGENGYELRQQVKTFYNVYYHAARKDGEKERIIHIVPATLPEFPGTVHISFRSYDTPEDRAGVEKDIEAAEAMLWADGRRIQ